MSQQEGWLEFLGGNHVFRGHRVPRAASLSTPNQSVRGEIRGFRLANLVNTWREVLAACQEQPERNGGKPPRRTPLPDAKKLPMKYFPTPKTALIILIVKLQEFWAQNDGRTALIKA